MTQNTPVAVVLLVDLKASRTVGVNESGDKYGADNPAEGLF